MSTSHNDVDEADRLARVKLSSTIEPGDLRVTGLVSEFGATKVLFYPTWPDGGPVTPTEGPGDHCEISAPARRQRSSALA